MAYLGSLMDALREAINAVWGDVATNGIYRELQFARIALDNKAANLPVAVIDRDLRSSSEWGLTNEVEEGTIVVYRIVKNSETPEQLETKLEALRQYLHDNPLDEGQVVEWPSVSLSLSLPANLYLAANQKPMYAGAVILRVVVGQTQ